MTQHDMTEGRAATGAVLRGPWPPAAADDDPWCRCSDAEGPHVHCPWGGMHIELVTEEGLRR